MIVVHVIHHFLIQNTRKYIKPEKLQLTKAVLEQISQTISSKWRPDALK